MRIETIVLRNLIQNEDYTRKVLPHLKHDYFLDRPERVVFTIIHDFITKYSKLPTKEILLLELERKKLDEVPAKEAKVVINEILSIDVSNTLEWLVDKTEEFCKETAVYNAIMKSVGILEKKAQDRGAISAILKDALAVSFDTRIGHDYLIDFEHQYEYYHKVEFKIPFDLKLMNSITNDGFSRKTLNIILAGTYVGKSLVMCHMAAANLLAGQQVLYITCELSEEMVRERVDANLLDAPGDMIRALPKDKYERKIHAIEAKTKGKLIIKEYPTATPSVMHFEHLLDELELKKSFKPDIIYVDYLNLCRCARVTNHNGMYEYFKMVAEELRGMAMEHNVVMVTATQLNREGFKSSEFGMGDVAESFAVSMTGDFIMGLQSSEELEKLGQIQVTQLKSRYQDISSSPHKKFVLGIDRPKFRLYDLEDYAQVNIIQSAISAPEKKFDFSGLKVE